MINLIIMKDSLNQKIDEWLKQRELLKEKINNTDLSTPSGIELMLQTSRLQTKIISALVAQILKNSEDNNIH
jgi:hypothetical protein